MKENTFDQKKARELFNQKNIELLKNKDFSLIASNCNGAFISHDLKLRFNTPTVNLFLYPDDFLKYVKDLERYTNCELTFIKEEGVTYPVGQLDDIKIYFMHYETEKHAAEKWNDRTERIDFDNLFIMMTDRDGCTLEHLKQFDELPYKNKVVFTHIDYPEIESAHYIPGFEDQDSVGDIYEFIHETSDRKHYDSFDYISWFNSHLN